MANWWKIRLRGNKDKWKAALANQKIQVTSSKWKAEISENDYFYLCHGEGRGSKKRIEIDLIGKITTIQPRKGLLNMYALKILKQVQTQKRIDPIQINGFTQIVNPMRMFV